MHPAKKMNFLGSIELKRGEKIILSLFQYQVHPTTNIGFPIIAKIGRGDKMLLHASNDLLKLDRKAETSISMATVCKLQTLSSNTLLLPHKNHQIQLSFL